MKNTVYFSNGSQVSGGRYTSEDYEIRANDICVIEPSNPRNKARGHRGRICKFTGKSRSTQNGLLAHVEFLDEKGGYGYVNPCDLKPHS
ncbi:M20 family metallopeptidase [Anabaena sp. UHCC 0187]|uniref:M20 family metallopeptidase n=1 Tax=Anabaena sp. UHCC 0187 TaxID=2590018 RepID=UPI001448431F|nr:M20 family metallopeptidase [Anabaena sp. UHCC 0187]MTJ15364.1 M20 family metallopeptidase [Anabaena sp. UHCC 0187]